jgi:hypothetical protein
MFPKKPHCAIICGSTECGKTKFILDILETEYLSFYEYIVIFCPTIKDNKTYKEREFILKDNCIFIVNPGNRLNECLENCYESFKGHETLFIIDDCSAEKDIIKKRNTLAKLAFSGRHVGLSVWVLTQKYNAVLKDFREQVKWVALFYCKDRKSFNNCLEENDVIRSKEKREEIKERLNNIKHSKLILFTEQPTDYIVLA